MLVIFVLFWLLVLLFNKLSLNFSVVFIQKMVILIHDSLSHNDSVSDLIVTFYTASINIFIKLILLLFNKVLISMYICLWNFVILSLVV